MVMDIDEQKRAADLIDAALTQARLANAAKTSFLARMSHDIRSLNRLDAKTIPIVAMTANAFAEDVEESRSAGMNEHISKPLDIGKVKMTIARYIGRKRS